MMFYRCTEEDCGRIFRMERAKFCPCCGSRSLRHALGREIDLYLQPSRPADGPEGLIHDLTRSPGLAAV